MILNNKKLNKKEMNYVLDSVHAYNSNLELTNNLFFNVGGCFYSYKLLYNSDMEAKEAFNFLKINFPTSFKNKEDYLDFVNNNFMETYNVGFSFKSFLDMFCEQENEFYDKHCEKSLNAIYKKHNENNNNLELRYKNYYGELNKQKRLYRKDIYRKMSRYISRILDKSSSNDKTMDELLDKMFIHFKEKFNIDLLKINSKTNIIHSVLHSVFTDLTDFELSIKKYVIPFYTLDYYGHKQYLKSNCYDINFKKHETIYFDYYHYKSIGKNNYNCSLDNSYENRGLDITAKTNWAIYPKSEDNRYGYQTYYNEFNISNLADIIKNWKQSKYLSNSYKLKFIKFYANCCTADEDEWDVEYFDLTQYDSDETDILSSEEFYNMFKYGQKMVFKFNCSYLTSVKQENIIKFLSYFNEKNFLKYGKTTNKVPFKLKIKYYDKAKRTLIIQIQ